MKILLLFSFALCQSHRFSFDLNQPYEKKHSFVRFQNLYMSKENRFLFSNLNKKYSIKNWFYTKVLTKNYKSVFIEIKFH